MTERVPLGNRIGFRLLVALLALPVLAVVVTGVAQYMLASSVMKENVAQRNVQIARRAAAEIDLYVTSSLRDLAALEQSIVPIRDPWVRDLILENSVTIHRQFRSVAVVSGTGEVIASSALENSTVDVPRELMAQALSSGQRCISSVRLSSDSGPYVLVALPAGGAGLDRVIVAELDLRDVWDMVDIISFGESGQAILLSGDGVLIAHPDKTKILVTPERNAIAASVLERPRQESYVVDAGQEGTPTLVAVSLVKEAGWYVVVQQHLQDAYVPVEKMLTNAGVTVLAFVLAAVLVSLFLARRFSTPLAMLLAGTERIRAGDLSHRIQISSEDEIGRLSRSFNTMVHELEERSAGLERSEAKYRLLAESLADIIFSMDAEGRLLYVNPQVERILGYPPASVEGKSIGEALPGYQQPPQLEAPGAGEEQAFETEVLAADGRKVILEVKLVRAGAAEVEGVLYGVARDVTERRSASLRLAAYQEQLRSLALQLALTEARERKRIAAELHDRIGQALALTRIKLGVLAGGTLPEEQAAVARETIPLLERVIQDTRTLIFNVSSPLLYEVGLSAALERLVEQFGDEQEGEFRFIERGKVPRLNTDLAVLLFDAGKELLVNAVKHSSARMVRVTLSARNGHVNLRVGDNGVGFDPGALGEVGATGYGLFSLRERLEYIGGTMDVRSRKGRGTWVTLAVPVAAEPGSEAAR